MTKDEVAAALDEIGTLLELKGENPFRTRTYHNASRILGQFQGDFKKVVADGKLEDIDGIGDALALKITTLVNTGKLKYLDDLRAETPAGMLDMLRLPGIGPKKVKALHDELKIDSIDLLKKACDAGEVAKLKGFGAKTQAKILEGIAFLGKVGKRVRIDLALPLGLRLLDQLKALPGVIRAELCGSLRRLRETAKDIDILLSSADAAPIMEAFVKLPEVLQVTGHGPTKSSIVAELALGSEKVVLNADLRIVTDDLFPYALQHFTGSKEHNVRLRQRAIEMGYSLSEYGLTGDKGNVPCETEEDIYKALGLTYIPPELREDTGEIAAAEKKQLPELIGFDALRGVFHNHTTYSDGTATLEEMALAAKALGWEYFGVGDHSQSLTVAHGLSPERVRAQWAEIDQLNKKLKGIQILRGTECDILADGSLDYDDELLAGFDYVVASVHSLFNLSEEDQTARVCKALAHPATTMLGHATGRLLLRRDGYKIDLEKVIQTAADHGKMIEINAQPMRLDLDWTYVKRARELGVKIVINPDAHRPGELALTVFGLHVARRGWLTAADVFNTLGLKAVLKELARMKG